MSEYRQCPVCKNVLEINDENFHHCKKYRTGYNVYCKECVNAKGRKHYHEHQEAGVEKYRLYRLKYPDKVKASKKKWNAKNKEHNLSLHRKWTANNREHYNEFCRNYRKKNWDRLKIKDHERRKEKIKTDVNFRVQMNLRRRMNLAIRRINAKKLFHYVELIGCSVFELKAHLASKFTEGMSWENYGKWHIDHIIPCCAFNLIDPQEQLKCFHYTNLQPLWAEDNLKKGDKIIKQESILG